LANGLSMKRPIGKFLRDVRAALSVEFVIGLPLIMAEQAIAFETGRVMMDQHALESGVRDASRFLARANISDCPAVGSGYWNVYSKLVVSGLNSSISASDITCSFVEVYDGSGNVLNRDFMAIEIKAEVTVQTPLIGSWGDGITISARDHARHIGE